jgi:hypothetical protein
MLGHHKFGAEIPLRLERLGRAYHQHVVQHVVARESIRRPTMVVTRHPCRATR